MEPKKKLFFNQNNGRIDKILNKSTRAICGVAEREVMVSEVKVAETKRILKSKGYYVVGTSEPLGRNRKIWFVPSGSF